VKWLYRIVPIDDECVAGHYSAQGNAHEGANMSNTENVFPRQDLQVSCESRLLSLIGGGAAIGFGARRGAFWRPIFYVVGAELLTFGLFGHYFHEVVGLKRAGQDTPNRRIIHQLGVQIRQSINIDRPVADVYDFFRNFERLPAFMDHLQSVKIYDDKRSHWTAKGPMGTAVEWDAEIISDDPNRLISWRSINTPDVETAGSVRFVPLSRNRTLLRLSMQYLPPAGVLGTVVAKLLGEEPDQQIKDDLLRFKELMESGTGTPSSQGTTNAHLDADTSPDSTTGRFSEMRKAAGSSDPT
jgi:uncharacterized membrane protein